MGEILFRGDSLPRIMRCHSPGRQEDKHANLKKLQVVWYNWSSGYVRGERTKGRG